MNLPSRVIMSFDPSVKITPGKPFVVNSIWDANYQLHFNVHGFCHRETTKEEFEAFAESVNVNPPQLQRWNEGYRCFEVSFD